LSNLLEILRIVKIRELSMPLGRDRVQLGGTNQNPPIPIPLSKMNFIKLGISDGKRSKNNLKLMEPRGSLLGSAL
jgi:hypothetical protein